MFTPNILPHEIDLIDAERHRNGVSGAPFDVLLFRHEECLKVAIVFEAPCHCAVLDLASLKKEDIRSKWRGDAFEPVLRSLIELRE